MGMRYGKPGYDAIRDKNHMDAKLFHQQAIAYVDHSKFARVKVAPLVTSRDSDAISVCLLKIEPETVIPPHTHDPQADSILVMTGEGDALINGEWQPIKTGDYLFVPPGCRHGIRNTGTASMTLFVHHGPPLL